MDRTLENFIKALRLADIPVSVGEALDAYNTTELIGFTNRQMLKNALSISMAKSADEKEVFEACFDMYFSRDLPSAATGAADDPGTEAEAGAEADMTLADLVLSGDANAMAQAMERAANEIGADNIRFFTQRGVYARRMLDVMGLRDMERAIAGMRRDGDAEQAGTADRLDAGREQLLDDARRYMQRQFEIYGVPASEQLRDEMLERARLTTLEARDLERMHRLVRRMAKRLAAKHSRRRRNARRGQLDMRRMMRSNVANDGVPFDIFFKYKKTDRPKVVAICDVSRSVASVARFLLLFLYSLNEVVKEIRSFAFSDQLIEVSDIFETMEADQALTTVMDKIGYRSTDYGQALEDFDELAFNWLDRRTTVVIMGDARSNFTDPRIDLMKRLQGRVKRVIWLNPEVPTVWGSGDSEMRRYIPFCHLARECNTVKHLERVIDDLLRAYSVGG
jgi:hypothetical protein